MSDRLPLGDLISIRRGTTYKGALLGLPGPVLLGLASIARDGGFRSDSLKTYGGASPDALLVKAGGMYASLKDVTQTGDLLGSVAQVPFGGKTGRLTQDTVRLDVISERVDPDFLYWSLLTPDYRAYCRRHATGTTTLGLPREDFLAFPIWLPPMAEQQRIASVLRSLDDLIQVNTSLAHALRELTRNLFEDLLHRVTNQGRASDVVAFKYGKALPARDRRPGNVAVVSSAGIVDWHDKALAKGPGVVVGRKGTAGSVTWVPTDFFPIDTAFYVESDWPALVVFLSLERLGLDRMNTDSAVPGLNRDNALAQVLPMPSSEQISSFMALAENLWLAATELESEAAQLRHTRDELLPLLLSGRVSVREVAA